MDMYLLGVDRLTLGLLRRSGNVVVRGLIIDLSLALATTLGSSSGLLRGRSALAARGLGSGSGRALTAGADARLDGGTLLLLQLLEMLPVGKK